VQTKLDAILTAQKQQQLRAKEQVAGVQGVSDQVATVLAKLDEKDVSMKAAELQAREKDLRSKESELVKEEHVYRTQARSLGLSSEEIEQKLASVSYDMGGLLGSIAQLRGELDGLQADVRKWERAAGAGAGAGARAGAV
jgi:chromosome segregation ATPase